MIDLNHSRNLAVRRRAGCFHVLFFLPVLMAGLALVPAGRVTAQTFTTLHSFTATTPGRGTNSDGGYPKAALILSGNTLYGTTVGGGSSGWGTVFKVNTNGTGFASIYSFTARSGPFRYSNSDGAFPDAALILSGDTLYGTAQVGGTGDNGTVFAVKVDGMGFTNLHSFAAGSGDIFSAYTNSDGAYPSAALILSGNTLYGTASLGGTSGQGTVFAVNSDGTGFTNLYSLAGDNYGPNAIAGLILSGNTLYGTAATGGSLGRGIVFKVSTNGSGFTSLHSFTATSGPNPPRNSDGAFPSANLILTGSTLYGTAGGGGSAGNGTVFKVNADGTGYTRLYGFAASNTNALGAYTNSDGAGPNGLILSGNTLYGTTSDGGRSGAGTVFVVNTDGTGFTTLYSFAGGSDGTHPNGLILSGNTLYGTASGEGSSGNGTIFSLSIPPRLTLTTTGPNLVLSWPTNFTGYALQSTTNLVSQVWTTNSPPPVVVNGQNTATNPISGTQQFFRLIQ